MSDRVASCEIAAAAKRLSGRVRRTPVLEADGGEFGVAGKLTLKLEFLQHTGTFKARGATNFMLSTDIGPAGVAAASGGNHGAAVAWAAKRSGHRAHIFVPTIAATAKVERLRSYGAQVTRVGDVYADALEACEHYQAETGATAVHAYDDKAVMAGAGTVGLELQAQAEPADSVLVACGGGGLVGGISSWFVAASHRPQIVVCETETTACFAAASAAGRPVDTEVAGIAADALGATRIGTKAFAALTAVGAEAVAASDSDVVDALAFMWETFRVVLEPAAAVPIAVLLSGRWRPEPGAHTAVIVCGANTSLAAGGHGPNP